MKMCDALMIGRTQKGSSRDDVFGISIIDGLQSPKLTLERGVAVNKPCHLNVNALAGTSTYEINLSNTQLPDGNRISKMNQMMVNDILHDLLNIRLAFAS